MSSVVSAMHSGDLCPARDGKVGKSVFEVPCIGQDSRALYIDWWATAVKQRKEQLRPSEKKTEEKEQMHNATVYGEVP